MEDSQREAMYKAWKNSKINLVPEIVEKNENSVILRVNYENSTYYGTFDDSKNTLGLIEKRFYFTQAFNSLATQLRSINKNIELEFPINKAEF